MIEQTNENQMCNQGTILSGVLELLETSLSACLELMERFSAQDEETVQRLLSDLRLAIAAIGENMSTEITSLEHAFIPEMLENIEDTLNDIQWSIDVGDRERAAMKMEFQLFPFLRQLRESFYFWGAVYLDKERLHHYYQTEFAERNQNFYVTPDEEPLYRLSIVVPAYNHLEVTKQCIEQLLKETKLDSLQAELILIDHGSSDGTLEYFEQLGVGKVIHFKRNVRMYMLSTLFQICQGRYIAFINNDILVTRNWAEILLTCLKSDPRIVAAVPTTPNISNLQMLEVPTNDPQKFVLWANRQNKSDPARWSDRARLMPPLGCFNTLVVNKLGFADPYFYTMEFWDDDFSLRARRAGYRQLVCDDVACYHFGSVTGKEAQQKESTLEFGRQLFVTKHGVDPWSNDFCYDYTAVQLLTHGVTSGKNAELLSVDGGFGDTALQVRNLLRRRGQPCAIYHLTAQKEHQADLAPQADAFELAESGNMVQSLACGFNGRQFSHVFFGRDLAVYEDYKALLRTVRTRMRPGGVLVFSTSNPFFALNLHAMLQFALPGNQERATYLAPGSLKTELEKIFSDVQIISATNAVSGVENFALQHWPQTKLEDVLGMLNIQKYYFVCTA